MNREEAEFAFLTDTDPAEFFVRGSGGRTVPAHTGGGTGGGIRIPSFDGRKGARELERIIALLRARHAVVSHPSGLLDQIEQFLSIT
jgi:hypothetical protein